MSLVIDTAEFPDGCTSTPAAGGSLEAETTYYYRVAAVTDTGETCASTSFNGTTTAVNKTLNLAWNAVAGVKATGGYKVYRNTSDSWSSGSLLLATVDTNSYTDDGDPAPGAGVPMTVTCSTVNKLPMTEQSLLPEQAMIGREGGQTEYLGSLSDRCRLECEFKGSTAKADLDKLRAIRAGGIACTYTYTAHATTWITNLFFIHTLSWGLDPLAQNVEGAIILRVLLELVQST